MSAVDIRVLYSWGANSCGQLGSGDKEDRLQPCVSQVPHPLEVLSIGGGGAFSILLKDNGQVHMSGNNDRGQQGRQPQDHSEDDTRFHEVFPQLNLKASQVAAGWDFLLVLTEEGSLITWGSNGFGQLGREVVGGKGYDPLPGQVFLPSKFVRVVKVAAGLRHGVCVTDSHEMFAWGQGRRGQLGVLSDGIPPAKSETPLEVGSLKGIPIKNVTAGMHHTAVLTSDGSVYVWGCNKFGQCCLAPESVKNVCEPQRIVMPNLAQGDGVESLSSGWTHMLARLASGGVYSWGRADLGQLGRPCEQNHHHIPTRVPELVNIKALTCSSEHNLALSEDGAVYAWGWNEHGICGNGNEENVLVPQMIEAFNKKTVLNIGTGAGHSFCVVQEVPVEKQK